jgi:hypothetical protein
MSAHAISPSLDGALGSLEAPVCGSTPMNKMFVGCRSLFGPFDYWARATQLGRPSEENDMQYILLIYANEAEVKARPPEETQRINGEYMTFTASIKQSGHMRAGEPLEPSSTATVVRVKSGKTVRTDGPFAETREQLGGFYIVEAKDLDEAVGLAARIPSAKTGAIEVRPIMKFPM